MIFAAPAPEEHNLRLPNIDVAPKAWARRLPHLHAEGQSQSKLPNSDAQIVCKAPRDYEEDAVIAKT